MKAAKTNLYLPETTNADESSRGHVGADDRSRSDYSDNRDSSGVRTTSSFGTVGSDTSYVKEDETQFDNHSQELRFTSSEEERRALEASQQRSKRLSDTISKVQSGELAITGDITTPVAAMYDEWVVSCGADPNMYVHSWARAETGEQFALRNQKYRELSEQYLQPQIERQINDVGSLDDGAMEFDGRWAPVDKPETLTRGGSGETLSTFPAPNARPFVASPVNGSYESVDGRALASEHGVAVKPGSRIGRLNGRMQPVIGSVAAAARELGLPAPTVASGNDSGHKKRSRHYVGQALDFRGNNLTIADGKRLERSVQNRLGSGFRVDFEVFPDDPSNNHLHVQTRGSR